MNENEYSPYSVDVWKVFKIGRIFVCNEQMCRLMTMQTQNYEATKFPHTITNRKQ